MADNLAVSPGSGATVGADDIASVLYQRVKLIHGIDGVNDGDVSSTNALPVDVKSALPAGSNTIGGVNIVTTVGLTDTELRATALPISATTLPLPTGAATSANQQINGLTDTEIRATALPVTIPALDNATDTITASLDTSSIMNDTTALTPKFAIINAATSGNNTLVAAVSGKKIRVLSLTVILSDATTVRFESGANGTALTGQMEVAANSGIVLPFSPVGHFETGSNVLLNLELSAANNADGFLTYVEV